MPDSIPSEIPEILLVEDNPDDVEFFVHTLGKAKVSARLRTLRDGAEALEFIFATGQYSTRPAILPRVIVLGLMPPKMNGLEVLRRLRSHPLTRTVPVVILSSSREEINLRQSYDTGANSYVVKPMDFDQFGEAVRMVCQYWLQFNDTPQTVRQPHEDSAQTSPC